MDKKTFKISLIILVIVIIILYFAGHITIIPTGYTGVKTSFGQIQEDTIKSGSVAYAIPLVERVYEVNNKQKEIVVKDEIWGETSDKTPVYATDITVTCQIQPEASSKLVALVSDVNEVVNKTLISSALKQAMSELSPDDVTVRSKIEPLARETLQEAVDDKYGEESVYINKIVIEQMDFDEEYNTAIQKKSLAQQAAATQKIENQTAIDKAEANKKIAIAEAEAEAEKTRIAAEAEAEANKKLTESLSEILVQYRKIEKWDGKMPTVTGGNAIISLDESEASN